MAEEGESIFKFLLNISMVLVVEQIWHVIRCGIPQGLSLIFRYEIGQV